jgi:integrase
VPVFKRNGVWYARAEVGKGRIERSAGKGASYAKAKELETELYRKLQDDRHAKRVGRSLNRTFGEALLHYLKQPETRNLRSYESLKSVANTIKDYLIDCALEETPEKAAEMKQVFLAQGLQPATINRRLALVRRILHLAYKEWKWIKSPLSVSLLAENNQRQYYPTPEEVQALAKACPNQDVGDALLVVYFTGMRRSEFLRVNRNPGEYIKDYRLLLYAGNKTKKPRRVPLANQIRPIVDRMPLKVNAESLRYSFEKAREALGMAHLHLHDLRHGFASQVIESGGSMKDVKDLLGHVLMQTTDRYTHLTDRHLETVVGRAFGSVELKNQ